MDYKRGSCPDPFENTREHFLQVSDLGVSKHVQLVTVKGTSFFDPWIMPISTLFLFPINLTMGFTE